MIPEGGGFVDAEAFIGGGSKEVLNIRSIVLMHVERTARLASSDWSGGFWAQAPVIGVNGSFSATRESWIQSPAEAFEHAVLALYDLIASHSLDDALDDVHSKVEVAMSSAEDSVKLHYEGRGWLRFVTEEGVRKRVFVEKSVRDFDSDVKRHRGRECRVLFRACLRWLKQNNYLAGDGVEEGLDE
jgi:hypothetical protein